MVYVLKLTKVKKTNKIILIAFTWELGTSVDAPKRMAAMCPWNFFFFVLILIGNDIYNLLIVNILY